MGDFNIDLLKCNVHSKTSEFIENCFAQGFLQLVTKPTRCYHRTATLIDHFYTNSKQNNLTCGILTSRLSDHFPLCTFIPHRKKKIIPKTLRVRSFNSESTKKIREVLENISWEDIKSSDDAQLGYDLFSMKFNELFDLYFPEKTVK